MTTATANKTMAYVRPDLTQYQLDAIFCEERYSLIEATTKSGKTVGCMAWLVEQALMGKAGQNFWWIAPIFPQAKIPYRRIKRGLPKGMYVANETELTLTLPNGAVIWFKGADKPDSLYGEDVYAAVIDEATRCKDEAWHAVRSTLTATRGPIRIIGNVKGRKNWAYTLARKAQAGAPNMHYAKITAYDAIEAGILDADEVADAKEQLPESVFKELYLAEPSDDEGNPFGISAIQKCIKPISDKEPKYWGVDLAKSNDWTVIIALDEDGAVCRYMRWQAPWEVTILRTNSTIGKTAALVDSTGVGDPVLEALQKNGHDNFEGYVFTSRSKQQLMEGLAVDIQQEDIAFPSGPIVDELETFEYVYTRTGVTYSAPEGLHDDCVCSLALAAHRKRTLKPPPKVSITRNPFY